MKNAFCTREENRIGLYKHHIVGGKFSILNKTEKDDFSYLEVWRNFLEIERFTGNVLVTILKVNFAIIMFITWNDHLVAAKAYFE